MAQKKPTYAEALGELEGIVAEIESEAIDVDVLAERVKRATYLISLCKGKLRETEAEVTKVLSKLEAEGDEQQETSEDEEPEAEDKRSPQKGGSLF